jgi:hypothetical protein
MAKMAEPMEAQLHTENPFSNTNIEWRDSYRPGTDTKKITKHQKAATCSSTLRFLPFFIK